MNFISVSKLEPSPFARFVMILIMALTQRPSVKSKSCAKLLWVRIAQIRFYSNKVTASNISLWSNFNNLFDRSGCVDILTKVTASLKRGKLSSRILILCNEKVKTNKNLISDKKHSRNILKCTIWSALVALYREKEIHLTHLCSSNLPFVMGWREKERAKFFLKRGGKKKGLIL